MQTARRSGGPLVVFFDSSSVMKPPPPAPPKATRAAIFFFLSIELYFACSTAATRAALFPAALGLSPDAPARSSSRKILPGPVVAPAVAGCTRRTTPEMSLLSPSPSTREPCVYFAMLPVSISSVFSFSSVEEEVEKFSGGLTLVRRALGGASSSPPPPPPLLSSSSPPPAPTTRSSMPHMLLNSPNSFSARSKKQASGGWPERAPRRSEYSVFILPNTSFSMPRSSSQMRVVVFTIGELIVRGSTAFNAGFVGGLAGLQRWMRQAKNWWR